MILQEVVDNIARKEQTKTEQGTVSWDQTNSVLHSPSRNSTCWACQGKYYEPNTIKTRRDKCPAWQSTCDKCKGKGHYSTAYSRCSQCGSWGHKSSRSRRCTQKTREPEQEVWCQKVRPGSVGSSDLGVLVHWCRQHDLCDQTAVLCV